MPKFLTKSRFKVGFECPTKLYYLDDSTFGSNNRENAFLEALAEGGFQVGELAKLYHPGGTEITSNDKEAAAKQTYELLLQEQAVIYEGSIKFQNLFIKADILLKQGNKIDLIEVKAKSFDPAEENPFFNKSAFKSGVKQINSEWEPYLMDVAFQAFVLKKAYPAFEVSSFLMLADKGAKATVDGLNQRFFLTTSDDGKTGVKVDRAVSASDLGRPILTKVNVDSELATIYQNRFLDMDFEQLVAFLSRVCEAREFVDPPVDAHCKTCEFRISEELKAKGFESGFERCWSKAKSLQSQDFKKPFVFDVWNFRKARKLLASDKVFMHEITEEDVSPTKRKGESGLSTSERQWIQIENSRLTCPELYLDIKNLRQEMAKWSYPLHFIDFETTMVAIPFNKGRRPYEQIAFQFSHHSVSESGKIKHEDEYINRKKGAFPNFEFVRELKKVLMKDQGTIFRYAAHENTVLCQIRQQLIESDSSIPDKTELIQFIESITTSTGSSNSDWVGKRNMIDLCELVKRFAYYPKTEGSNSIKKVLPAILNASAYLQARFSLPIYGTDEIESRNFSNWNWIVRGSKNEIVDPYKLLPPIFTDLDLDTMDSLITEGSIADGGAAMTAYARMQFSEMSDQERDRVCKALLKYCELDTFAMVLIYLEWKNAVEQKVKKVA